MVPRFTKRSLRQLVYLLALVSLVIGGGGWVARHFWHPRTTWLHEPEARFSGLEIRQCSKLGVCGKGGVWAKHPKDLLLGNLWTGAAHVFLLTAAAGVPVVVDVAIGDTSPNEALPWRKGTHGLWLLYGSDHSEAVSGINVLFGDDSVDPRPGWVRLAAPLRMVHARLPVYLTVRKGLVKEVPRKALKINPLGTFKILQVADMHFSTGSGLCRDPHPPLGPGEECAADSRTLAFVETVLETEKPDFVVLSGDQIFGEASYDLETSLLKAVRPFVERKIPYAITMGNHDDEGSMSRAQIMAFSCALPYSLASMGPSTVDGYGNYVLMVEAPKSRNPAMTLYFLDTHSYSPNKKVFPGYDWLKPSQLEFIRASSDALRALVQKYTHIHMAMAFFHIPLPEYREEANTQRVGTFKEGITAPYHNSGARQVLGEAGVSVVSVGHDHCNDYCALNTKESNSMWLCYGGGSGEGGYGGYGGTSRRVRVFTIDTNANSIRSWKRQENAPLDVFDEQVLVADGMAVSV